jgi:CHAT domain-containing protein
VFDEQGDERVRLARQAGEKLRLAQGQSPLNLMAAAKDFDQVALERLNATARLPGQLRRLYEEIDVLTGLAASEPQVKHSLPRPYRYQVLATHGILNGQVPYIQELVLVFSQVLAPVEEAGEGFWQGLLKRLALGRETPVEEDRTPGFLTLTEVMNLKLNTELVALTACSTGVGKQVTDEGGDGARAGLSVCGRRGVLMSLWSMDEASTVLLVERQE